MRKRSRIVPLHLTTAELRHLDEQCRKAGLSREAFLSTLR